MEVTQMEEIKQQQDEQLTQELTLLTEQGRVSSSKRNPPARNTSRFWFERFLAVIQRQNPSVIDSSFLNQIAPSNEGKLLAQLKFLRVIDEQGKPTQLLPELNMVGEEQKKGFQEIARQSYSDLFNEVKIEKALPDDLINFFIRRYAFTRDKAVNAARFFLYLAEKGSIPVSQELGALLSEKVAGSPSSSSSNSTPKLEARSQRVAVKEFRPSLQAVAPSRLSKKALRQSLQLESQPAIHATINITLDKDTPKEYWDRVLALLGESKDEEPSKVQGVAESPTQETETPES